MATLHITEYAYTGTRQARSNRGTVGHDLTQVPREPAEADQAVTFTTATQSAKFGSSTILVRILSDADCHVLFGENPTALTTNQKLKANVAEWRAVTPGQMLSVVSA